jgi:uncharacterized protein YcfL
MKTKLVVLCAATLALAGCHNPMNSVENAQKTGQRAMVSDYRVVNDTGLSRAVSVVGINTANTPGGVLKVQVELLNRTKSLHRFSYRFEWFDVNGMQISSLSAAVSADQIEGGESKFISAIAPTTECKDFRLKLLEGAEHR